MAEQLGKRADDDVAVKPGVSIVALSCKHRERNNSNLCRFFCYKQKP
jgi:hypothetical protein